MNRLYGVFLVAVSAVSFGAMPILARIAYASGASPITVLFLRFAIAAICMSLVMIMRGTALPDRRTFVGLLLLGAVYVGQSFAYFTALTLAPAGLVGILLYIYPVVVTILALVFFKESVTKAKVAGLGLSLIGLVFTIRPAAGGHLLGVVLALAAALIYALYITLASKIVRTTGGFSSASIIVISTAAVFGGLVAVQGVELPTTFLGWAAVLALALISTVLAVGTFFAGLKRLDPITASVVSTLEPVVTVVLAAMILGEIMPMSSLIGGMIVVIAVIVLIRSGNNKKVIPGKLKIGT